MIIILIRLFFNTIMIEINSILHEINKDKN